jgi:PAS domain S-box-containing protein
MIHMVNIRVKNPLTRLLRSLSKTAKGDGYYIIEENKDAELNTLIGSFNDMSRQLIENNNRLHSYSRQATEMNIQLLQSHLFLSTLIKSSPYPIIVTGKSGRITMANDHAQSALDYSEEALVGRDLAQLVIIPSDLNLSQVNQQRRTKGFEARCSKPDGSSFPVFIISSPIGISGESPDGWLYIIRDISESQSFQDMMIRLDRYYTRGEMAGDIAHDINNFLAILSGNLELMPLVLRKNDPEKIESKLSLMKETVDKIAMFANGLMDTPPEELNLEPSDLNQLLANVVEFIKPLKRLRGVSLTLELTDQLPLVAIDRAQLQQVMTNLIFNSAEALRDLEEAKTIVIATDLASNGDKRTAIIRVQDSGPGVRQEYLDRIFQKRFTTRRKGHGIGLISCRKIVEAHGGTIGYEYHDGALFECRLPIHSTVDSDTNVSQTEETSILIG